MSSPQCHSAFKPQQAHGYTVCFPCVWALHVAEERPKSTAHFSWAVLKIRVGCFTSGVIGHKYYYPGYKFVSNFRINLYSTTYEPFRAIRWSTTLWLTWCHQVQLATFTGCCFVHGTCHGARVNVWGTQCEVLRDCIQRIASQNGGSFLFIVMILKLGQFQFCSWRDQTKYSISDSSSNFSTLDWYDIHCGWLANACASSWGHQMTWRPCWQRPFSAHTESLPLSADSWNFNDRALNTNTDRYK